MRRVLALVIAALAIGGFVGYGIYVYLQDAETRALSRYELVEVLVSKEIIPEGTTLAAAVAEGLAGPEGFPADFLPSNALTEVSAERASLVTIEELAPGQVLLSGDFVPAPDAPRLLEVPEGMVAISLALPEEARLGPFLQAGERVAIVATSATANPATGLNETRVLVPNVEVLAVGAVSSPQGVISSGDNSGRLVTVAVKPSDLVSVVGAATTASVYLSLLGDGSDDKLRLTGQ